jgi:hypothetical protein
VAGLDPETNVCVAERCCCCHRSSSRYNRRRRKPQPRLVDFKVDTALGVIVSEKMIAKKVKKERSLPRRFSLALSKSKKVHRQLSEAAQKVFCQRC